LLNGVKILVAEDNLINQKIANYILSKQGAVIFTALNGKEAIELLETNAIDVILMDLQMPGMDGVEAATYIRGVLKNNVPIIALTADAYANESNDYEQAGINTFLAKPFDPVMLCDTILSLIKNQDNKIKSIAS